MTTNVATAAPADEPDKPPKDSKAKKTPRTKSHIANNPQARKEKNAGRTSAAEVELRTHQLADRIARGQKKWQLKEWAYAEWNIAARTFEDYYTRAHVLLLAISDLSPEEEYRKSCAYYDAMIAQEGLSELGLQARQAKDRLTGIQRPKKHVVTDADGEAVKPVVNLSVSMTQCSISNMTTEDLKKLVEARKLLHSIAEATGKSISQGEGAIPAANGNAEASGSH